MARVSVDTTVDVDVDLNDFDRYDLVDYLRNTGDWTLINSDDYKDFINEVSLTREECAILLDTLGNHAVGSTEWFLEQKIRSWYYAR